MPVPVHPSFTFDHLITLDNGRRWHVCTWILPFNVLEVLDRYLYTSEFFWVFHYLVFCCFANFCYAVGWKILTCFVFLSRVSCAAFPMASLYYFLLAKLLLGISFFFALASFLALFPRGGLFFLRSHHRIPL